ncbi:MAG: CCA tRNA nucleotidyltransferase [Chloroflexi bacterium]|nr:CCA tRNA nucleotidyltransferase [Chloroflexota bacterium]
MSYVDYLRAALAEPDWLTLQHLAEIATRAGMSLYIVGGPVRDCLLRRAVTDLDLTTEGDALKLARTMARELGGAWKKFDRFGTAKLILPGRENPIDLATTRTETYAHPGALPDVTLGTIEADLIRRDFTINAMAIRLDGAQQGTLIDRYGGEADVFAGVLRVLHDHSFQDDPTRLFRGVRFEQRFNFVLAVDTEQLIAPALPVIDQVSGDRIRHELELIFCEAQPLKALARLNELGLLRQIEPDLQVDEWIAERFQSQAAPFDPFTCWGWLACRLSESSLTRLSQRVNLARADAIDLKQVQAVRNAVETIGRLNSRSSIYRALAKYHDRSLRAALTVIDPPAAQAAIGLYLNELRTVKSALDGTRLQELGVLRGPVIGRILAEVHAALLDGMIATPQQEEEYAQQIIAREGYGA